MSLRLAPLPRTQIVRTTIALPISLKEMIEYYASVLAAETGTPKSDPATLILHMTAQFMARDRAFQRAWKGRQSGEQLK